MAPQYRRKLAAIGIRAAGFLLLALTTAPSLSAQAQATLLATATVVTVPQYAPAAAAAAVAANDSLATSWVGRGRAVVAADGLIQAVVIRRAPINERPDRAIRVTVEYSAN